MPVGRSAPRVTSVRDEALSALTVLGIAKAQAEKSLDQLLETNPAASIEELIRGALRR